MKKLLNKLIQKHHISDERVIKIVTARIQKDATDILLLKLKDEIKKQQDNPDDVSFLVRYFTLKAMKLLNYFKIYDEIAIKAIQYSVQDATMLYYMIHDYRRTVSASLILRYANVAYSLSYDLPIALITGASTVDIIAKFTADKEELKKMVQEVEGLENSEMQELNRWDTELQNLLQNNGDN